MGTRDPRVDAYIDHAADFARPILMHIRETVHRNCPQVEETLKWRMPTFMYHGMLCGMAAFKQHCSFGFWKHALVVGADGGPEGGADGMGQFGKITKVSELPPPRALAGYIRKAMQLNEQGVTAPRATAKRRTLAVPDDLTIALKNNRKAAATFEAFSPTNKRDYVEWIVEAKREETRSKRLAQAIEWMAEGKPRNWKYMNC
jgi:uncharacterized protein YdeI (YjbR/CyaY-like superfamily)